MPSLKIHIANVLRLFCVCLTAFLKKKRKKMEVIVVVAFASLVISLSLSHKSLSASLLYQQKISFKQGRIWKSGGHFFFQNAVICYRMLLS